MFLASFPAFVSVKMVIMGQSMGVVLNISQNDILLKTSCLVESEYVMLMAADFNN